MMHSYRTAINFIFRMPSKLENDSIASWRSALDRSFVAVGVRDFKPVIFGCVEDLRQLIFRALSVSFHPSYQTGSPKPTDYQTNHCSFPDITAFKDALVAPECEFTASTQNHFSAHMQATEHKLQETAAWKSIYADGSGSLFFENAINNSVDTFFLILPRDSSFSRKEDNNPPEDLTLGLLGNKVTASIQDASVGFREWCEVSVTIKTVKYDQVFSSFRFVDHPRSHGVRKKYLRTFNSLNYFPEQSSRAPSSFLPNSFHVSLCNAVAVQMRFDFGLLNSVGHLRSDVASVVFDSWLANLDQNLSPSPKRPSRYRIPFNPVARKQMSLFKVHNTSTTACKTMHSSRHYVRSGQFNVPRMPGKNLEIHVETFGNDNTYVIDDCLAEIIRLVTLSNGFAALGVPRMTDAFLLVRERNTEHGRSWEDICEAAWHVEGIENHSNGGKIQHSIFERILVSLWLLVAIMISGVTFCRAAGSCSTVLDGILEAFKVLGIFFLAIFCALKLTHANATSLLNAILGRQLFRSVGDVQKYMFANFRNVPLSLAVAATTEKLEWLAPVHTSYLENEPCGRISFSNGVRADMLSEIGVLVGPKVTLDYRRGCTWWNKTSTGKYVQRGKKLRYEDLHSVSEEFKIYHDNPYFITL